MLSLETANDVASTDGSTAAGIVEDHVGGDQYPETFQSDFIEYCRRNGVDAAEFTTGSTVPRYFYATPRLPWSVCTPQEILTLLNASLAADAEPPSGDAEPPSRDANAPGPLSWVPWLPSYRFLQGPSHSSSFRVGSWSAHRSGWVVGMDAASVLSVIALSPRPGETVLDLCAAPGMKLGLIADAVSWQNAPGLAVGVDISLPRLYTACSCLKRRGVRGVALVYSDGRCFTGHHADISRFCSETPKMRSRRLRRAAASKQPATKEELIVHLVTDGGPLAKLPDQYDRVLVDAECTHDGSMAHMVGHAARRLTRANAAVSSVERKMHRPEPNATLESGRAQNTSNNDVLEQLQYDLLHHAFQLVKPGGCVVYSTCSFAPSQNEDVVRRLLAHQPSASLVCPFTADCTDSVIADPLRCTPDNIKAILERAAFASPGLPMCRFTPTSAGTSFQFVAKILKTE